MRAPCYVFPFRLLALLSAFLSSRSPFFAQFPPFIPAISCPFLPPPLSLSQPILALVLRAPESFDDSSLLALPRPSTRFVHISESSAAPFLSRRHFGSFPFNLSLRRCSCLGKGKLSPRNRRSQTIPSSLLAHENSSAFLDVRVSPSAPPLICSLVVARRTYMKHSRPRCCNMVSVVEGEELVASAVRRQWFGG